MRPRALTEESTRSNDPFRRGAIINLEHELVFLPARAGTNSGARSGA